MKVGDLVNVRDPLDNVTKIAMLLSVPEKKPWIGYTITVLLEGKILEVIWDDILELNKKIKIEDDI